MKTCLLFVSVAVALFCLSACSATPSAAGQPEFRTTNTLREVMESTVEPNADFLWNSVATISDAQGIREEAPKTDEDWDEVRRHAVSLIEATNLILIPGRKVARPGEKADDPKIELSPDQIEALLKSDPKAFTDFVKGLYDAATVTLKAIDAKDTDELLKSGEGIDKACENCHLKYWYPNEPKELQ